MITHYSKKIRLIGMACAALFLLCGAVPAKADNSSATVRPQILRDVGIDQNLNQQIPLDLTFRDETGKTVQLGQYFGKKPVVLSLVYFGCPMLCTMVEDGLLQSLKQVSFDVGDQYNVLTVSFDPHDTPEIAAAKKALYVGLYGRPGAAAGWHFLTGDPASIQKLTKAVGFHYAYDATSGQFAHATAIMVLTPQGKLARYFYGIQYPPGGIRLALVEAAQEKIGSPVDAVLLFCCAYNPATGKYGLVISRLLMIAGMLTVLTIAALIFMLSRAGTQARARTA
ncbi:MAG TPA: SCO family protein [Terriglobia bacterium]|nr:SCO family protein [Terriglobia bacterium]